MEKVSGKRGWIDVLNTGGIRKGLTQKVTAEQGLEGSGGDGHEDVADSIPVRRHHQGTDVRMILRGRWCDWSRGGACGREAPTDAGSQILQGPVGHCEDFGFCSMWNGNLLQGFKQKDEATFLSPEKITVAVGLRTEPRGRR